MISNSTPLIYLAKLGRLEWLKEFFGEIRIPKSVRQEVVERGKELNQPDAVLVEEAIEDGWIEVEEVDPLEDLENLGIDQGEREAISLAVERDEEEILVDQTHARTAAKMMGLEPRGTLYVFFKALKRDRIDYDRYVGLLEELLDAGFRMSEEVYLEALRLGEKVAK